MKRLFMLLLLISTSYLCFSETIRGNLSGILRLDERQEEQQLALYLDQLAGLEFDLENPFLEGLEILLHIPQQLQNYRNSFAVYLYKDLTPLPDLQVSRYQGNQVMMHILPTQNQLALKIPLRSSHSIIRDASSIVSTPQDTSAFPLLIALVPIMKGVPQGAYEWPITMEINPIYQNMGGFQIEILSSDPQVTNDLVLLLNGQEINYDPEQLYHLSPGIHNFIMQSLHFGSKEYSIAIEAGEIYFLQEEISAQPAMIHLQEYPGITYRINGEDISLLQQELSPGSYELEIQINPDWVIREQIQIRAGETLNYQLEIDLITAP